MSSKGKKPQGGLLFPVVAVAATVSLAGQLTPVLAWITYVGVLVWAGVTDWLNTRR